MATNPCLCGFHGSTIRQCRCSPIQIENYLGKISGPLLDRIAIHVAVRPVDIDAWKSPSTSSMTSGAMREMVLAANRLALFFGYVATVNPRTRFLVYSRSAFRDAAQAEQWVRDTEARLPALRGRLYPFSVPSEHGKATFRDAETARLIRERIQEILDLR